MNLQWIHAVQSGADRSLRARLLRCGTWILSLGYRAVIGCQNWGYDRRWLHSTQLPAFVVSVGNITTGGTGKTPLVGWVVHALQEITAHAALLAIVSRGYRAGTEGANDEKLVLDLICPSVPHLQNRHRTQVALDWLIKLPHAGPGTIPPAIVLDDAMQHRQLQRQANLVVIDATHPFGHRHLLPRGMLREPLSSLRRADWFLITRCEMVGQRQLEDIRRELTRHLPAERISEVEFRPSRLINAAGETRPIADLQDHAFLPFCGIGNPSGFLQMLKHWVPEANEQLAGPLQVFDDHHHYDSSEIDELGLLANAHEADWLVTTVKDLVKISQRSTHGVEIWAVDIAPSFRSGEAELKGYLAEAYRIFGRSRFV